MSAITLSIGEERLLQAARIVVASAAIHAAVTWNGKRVEVADATALKDPAASSALLLAITIGSSYHTDTGEPASGDWLANELRNMGELAAADWLVAQTSTITIRDPEWVDCSRRGIGVAAEALARVDAEGDSLVVQALRRALVQVTREARATDVDGLARIPFVALQAVALGLAIEAEVSCAPAPEDRRSVDVVLAVAGADEDDRKPAYGRVTIDAAGLQQLLQGHRAMRASVALGSLQAYPVAWEGISPAIGSALVLESAVVWRGEDLVVGAYWDTEPVEIVDLIGRWVRSKPGDVIFMSEGAKAAFETCAAPCPGM